MNRYIGLEIRNRQVSSSIPVNWLSFSKIAFCLQGRSCEKNQKKIPPRPISGPRTHLPQPRYVETSQNHMEQRKLEHA